MTNLLISGVGAGSATIHAKHRTSGGTVDIPTVITGGAGFTPVKTVYADSYATDSALRADMVPGTTYSDPTKVGTGSGTVTFRDTINCDLITLDSTNPSPGRGSSFLQTFPANGSGTFMGGTYLPSPVTGLWARVAIKLSTNFTTYGNRPGDSSGASASYKLGMLMGFSNYDGRDDAELTTGTFSYASAPTSKADGSPVTTSVDTLVNTPDGTFETDGQWYWIAAFHEYIDATHFRWRMWVHPYSGSKASSKKLDRAYTMIGGNSVPNVTSFGWQGANYNRTNPAFNMYIWRDQAEAVLQSASADPWGYIAVAP